MSNKTDFSNVCQILSDLWMDYREDEEFEDFISYNDIGLPLAYAVEYKLCKPTEAGIKLIEETWDLLISALEIEDTGFTDIGDLFEVEDKE